MFVFFLLVIEMLPIRLSPPHCLPWRCLQPVVDCWTLDTGGQKELPNVGQWVGVVSLLGTGSFILNSM